MQRWRNLIMTDMQYDIVMPRECMAISGLIGPTFLVKPPGPTDLTATFGHGLMHHHTAEGPVICIVASADPPFGTGARVVRARVLFGTRVVLVVT
jgi:hypothetical protein